ncbi:uncharacterized protein BCR38DRAFT_484415 [Pseudomassariella vexata]|uniref:UDP-N-acetylglucosamine transferase subunit ALG13 n=1 Tax=Pseudomassariella vexata TaxID=1141098 RepID=A0A1Y2E079_9PEZI|nr:uncharacterized protein BCR38DRAFT_484415 [Pseudomassariella vexata]ORY64942.1 hypothetical protein BCR38DRAFT_484415 [Pseudomassariella vexata]
MVNSPELSDSESERQDYKRAKSFFIDAVVDPLHEFGAAFMASRENPLDDLRLIQDPALVAAVPLDRRPPATMFVTIGATASFKDLITEVLSPQFLEVLAERKIMSLIVQCGPDLKYFEEIRPQKGFDSHWIDITGFDYTNDMKGEMVKCTPSDGRDGGEERSMGIIVSHAGAGTILDAMKVNSRLIVVPNATLMDNHQVQLAKAMDKEGYLVHGHLGRVHEAVKRIDKHLPPNWPPQPPPDSIYYSLEDVCQEVLQNSHSVHRTKKEEEEYKSQLY